MAHEHAPHPLTLEARDATDVRDAPDDLGPVLDAVGPRLRELRLERGTTLAQLSETTGISVSTLSRLESGGRKPTLELLLPLARAHQVALDELVDSARRELDLTRRKKIYSEAQEIICDEAPWAFTHNYRFYAQWQPYVHDYRPHPTWTTDATRTWVDRATGPMAARALFSGDALAKLLGDGASKSRGGPAP